MWGALAVLALVAASCSSGTTAQSSSTTQPLNAPGVGQPSPFLGGNLSTIGCGAPALCVAAGSSFDPNPTSAVLAISRDSGTTWQPVRSNAPASASFTSASCAGASCLVAGQASGAPWATGARVTAHPTWAPTTPLPDGSGIDAVACVESSRCVVIGGQSPPHALLSTDAGQSWQTLGALPSSVQTITQMTCSSRSHCVAAGLSTTGGPVVTSTSDGGTSWQTAALPTTVSSVLSVACSSAGRCLATGRQGAQQSPVALLSTNGAQSFAITTSVGSVRTPLAVSCAATTCVLVGSGSAGGAAAVYRGVSPASTLALHFVPTALVAVSCPTSSWCEAASTSSLVHLAP